MREDDHGRLWSEEPHIHLVVAWDERRDAVDDGIEPFEAECEAEACEAAQDVIHECARAGLGFSVAVVALPEWVLVASFSVRRVATWN